MTVGLGVDIVEIKRIAAILARSPSFARRAFTADEQAYCNARSDPAPHYAARFAAKEAVCKALGTGILSQGVRMTDVEVVRDARGKPVVALHGAALQAARAQGVVDIPLSLTYTHAVAVANAVAITERDRAPRDKRRDEKDELTQRFKDMRSALDELGAETAAGVCGAAADCSDTKGGL